MHLNLPPKGKARPRVTHNGTYMPPEYQRWMSAAVLQLRKQWDQRPTLDTVDCLTVYLWGREKRGDVDNLAGSVLDALVKAKVLANDGVRNVPALHVEWHQSIVPHIHLLLTYAESIPNFPGPDSSDAAAGARPG
jgi:Holliday junction resolvase RusA-like endonuclease